jgi:hypothetical protein
MERALEQYGINNEERAALWQHRPNSHTISHFAGHETHAARVAPQKRIK